MLLAAYLDMLHGSILLNCLLRGCISLTIQTKLWENSSVKKRSRDPVPNMPFAVDGMFYTKQIILVTQCHRSRQRLIAATLESVRRFI